METFRAIYAATPNHLIDLAMLTVVQSFTSFSAALDALIRETGAQGTVYTDSSACNAAPIDGPADTEFLYTYDAYAQGEETDTCIGHIHVWMRAGSVERLYTIEQYPSYQ